MGNKVLKTIYLEQKQSEMLMEISKKTKINQAVIVREGIDLIIEKYGKELKNAKR